MKNRMTIDDIQAMVASIYTNIINMRVTNIYDIDIHSNNKTYIFKLNAPPLPKVYLLLDSGTRFHTTNYARERSNSSNIPSQFTMKLRKHIRGKKLTNISQLSNDRVVDFEFGGEIQSLSKDNNNTNNTNDNNNNNNNSNNDKPNSLYIRNPEYECHIILELYSSGNIILTDGNYQILSLLRTFKYDNDIKIAVRQIYPINTTNEQNNRMNNNNNNNDNISIHITFESFQDKLFKLLENKKSFKKVPTLKQIILMKGSGYENYGPSIIEHCILSANLDPSSKIQDNINKEKLVQNNKSSIVLNDKNIKLLFDALKEAPKIMQLLMDRSLLAKSIESNKETNTKQMNPFGFIVLKDTNALEKKNIETPPTLEEAATNVLFDEFTPYLYKQHENKKYLSFQTFDEAVDEYFSHIETQNFETKKKQTQENIKLKLNKLEKNQQDTLDTFLLEEKKALYHAKLIEMNLENVEKVLLIINSALASGMDWIELKKLVKVEQKNGNYIASLIHNLNLENNKVSILLSDNNIHENDSEYEENMTCIDIDLSLSAYANARNLYSYKKKMVIKKEKAVIATTKAIEIAKKKTDVSLMKQTLQRNKIYARRKVYWFEKFHWFLTSENYLAIAGKDAQQNEMLVKRYLKKGDIYIHADLHGAPSCIVKNKPDRINQPIPTMSIEQSACMTVCRSHAWANNVIESAYWVEANQVSKTAPTGEYLTTGSFMIRGKKNYIHVSRLEMGLGLLFKIDSSCVSKHEHERNIKKDVLSNSDKDINTKKDENQTNSDDFENDHINDNSEATNSLENDKLEEEKHFNIESNKSQSIEKLNNYFNDVSNQSNISNKTKKRISAKEKRELKKIPESNNVDVPNNEKKEDRKVNNTSTNNNGKQIVIEEKSVLPLKQNVRGKKGKLKKIKKKYAEQDEEDRILYMEALGNPIKNEKDDTNVNINEIEKLSTRKDENSIYNKKDIVKKENKSNKDDLKIDIDLNEPDLEEIDNDFFSTFISNPLEDDILLFSIPVCAPYNAISQYKYKVKLTPGSQKKGKACKQALNYFLKIAMDMKQSNNKKEKMNLKELQSNEQEETEINETTINAEIELMKYITDNELIGCIVGPAKISAPGLRCIIRSQKKKK